MAAAAMRAATAPHHAPRAYGAAAVSTSARRGAAAPRTATAAVAASSNDGAARVVGAAAFHHREQRRRRNEGGLSGAKASLSTFNSSTTAAAATASSSSSSSSPSTRGGGLRRRRGDNVAMTAVINPVGDTTDNGTGERTSAAGQEKVGILLLNLGGPEKLEDVQPFLYNLFADPDIIRLPPALQFLQSPLAALLSNSRAPKSREAYESIGGGSPLRRITARRHSGEREGWGGGRGRAVREEERK